MSGSQQQSHGDAVSIENSLEPSTTTLLRFYQQQKHHFFALRDF